MQETVQETGIFRRITRQAETPAEFELVVQEWQQDHDAEKRLGDVAQTLQAIVAEYRDKAANSSVIKGKRYEFGHRYGNLASDAPPEAFDARNALMLVDDVRACISQQNIEQAVIAAYELGFTVCQVGVRRHEATIKGRAKGPAKRKEIAEQTKQLIRDEFIRIRDQGMLGTQADIVDRMLDEPKLADGSAMPARRVIEVATQGLMPRKKSRKSPPKR